MTTLKEGTCSILTKCGDAVTPRVVLPLQPWLATRRWTGVTGASLAKCENKNCVAWQLQQAVGGRPPRHAPPLSSPPKRRRADGNVAVVSHGQHVPTPTTAAAWRANTAVSKAAWWPWPLTLKVVSESCVTRATSMPILVFLWPLCSRLRPDVRDRRQTASSLYAPPIRGGAGGA